MSIFLKQGVFIGLIGSTLGMAMALVLSLILESYQIIDLPDLYLLAKLPVNYSLFVYLGVALSGVVICIFAGLYPAWLASRQLPSVGFRSGL